MAFDFMKEIIRSFKESYENSGFPVLYLSHQTKEYFVPMRDSIRLQTIIYQPSGPGVPTSLPVILTRTCYPHMKQMMDLHGEHLARRGFILVLQFCRGQAASEGEWVPNVHERNDGIDTVWWLADQPWCESIGCWGLSYTALTGWAMADAVEGKVTSMMLSHYGTDRHVSAYEKGCFRQDVLTSWTMDNAGFPITADFKESCRYLPQIEVDNAMWGRKIDWYRDYITSPKASDPYWQQGWWKELRDIPAKTRIPLYILSGWYDHHHGSTMVTWQRLNEDSKKHSWLEIGGWNHFFQPCLQDRTMAQLNNNEIIKMLEWFTITLKEKKLPEQKIRTYTIGLDQWSEYDTWEGLKRTYTPWYLDASDDQHHLFTQLPQTTAYVEYKYDPANPVPTHGAENILKSAPEIGSLLQPKAGWRDDVTSFISPVLEEDLTINGKIQIELWVKSSCADTAFTAKIMEVTEKEKAYNIRSSITTISHGSEAGETYTPDSAVKVVIDMSDIVYCIKVGHRIRIDISSSDFPQHNVHTNTPGIWALQEHYVTARQTILTGASYPSKILIPELS